MSKKLNLFLTAFILLLCVSCGSSGEGMSLSSPFSSSENGTVFYEDAAAPAAESPEIEYETYFYENSYTEESSEENFDVASYPDDIAAQSPDLPDKKVKNGSMEIETEEIDSLVNNIENTVISRNGYVESKNSSTYMGENGNEYKNVSVKVRIPAADYEYLTSYVMENSNVLDFYDSILDMSSEYADIQSHLNVKKLEEERLLTFIEESKNISGRIDLERRLGEVRSEIESYEMRALSIDRKVSFSSLNINISEVDSPFIKPLNADLTLRAQDGIKASFNSVLELLQNLLILVVYISLPAALVGFCGFCGFFAYKRVRKK